MFLFHCPIIAKNAALLFAQNYYRNLILDVCQVDIQLHIPNILTQNLIEIFLTKKKSL
jgi:hypothetical protein